MIERFVTAVELSPHWFVDDDLGKAAFALRVIAQQRGKSATIGFSAAGVDGSVEFRTDPCGYLVAIGRIGAAEVFRGYIDQPYEEFDIWPAGAEFDERRTIDAPGRIGKRGTWIVIDSKTWPAFAPIANEVGYFLAQSRD